MTNLNKQISPMICLDIKCNKEESILLLKGSINGLLELSESIKQNGLKVGEFKKIDTFKNMEVDDQT